MKRQITFLFFILMTAFALKAQNANTEDVSAYLESNGSMAQYDYAYGELLKMLGNQFPKNDTNKEGWTYLENNKKKALADMKKLLVPIYQSNFSKDEVNKMLAFYESDAGKQLINDRSQMTETQKAELNSFYNTEVGQKIIEKQPVLTQEISKASENWSRDLYETALSLLK